ncbi:MAG: RDD family protein [Elusimicrobia bacterium]|nr:RDD family protein [Elusimicrobiota bacterium]
MDIPPQTPAPAAPSSFPPQALPPAAAEPVPAGFWIRAGAYMIDGLLVTVGQMLLLGCLVLVGIPRTMAQLGSSLLGVAYFIWMPVANSGQTLGKMAAGIAIVRMDGTPLTYLRCLGRWAGYIVSSITLGLGFLIAAFTDRKRALHDYICDTRVIYVDEVSGLRRTLVILAAFVPVVFGIVAALAIPKFMQMASGAQERQTLGELGALRSALSTYRSAQDARYPEALSAIAPKYLPALPTVRLKSHAATAEVQTYGAAACSGQGDGIDPTKIQDTGKWGYVSDPAAPCYGAVFVDCVHPDVKNQKQWASY